MTDVRRFDLSTDNTHYYGVPVIEECEDGDYVLSADYDALKEERDRLRDALQAFDDAAKDSKSIIGFAGKCMGLLKKARAALAAYRKGELQ